MTSIFLRPPRNAQSISAQFAEVPVRTFDELVNAIGQIGARCASGPLGATGGSILICAPLTFLKPIIIPESCPGLTIRAAAKFPLAPASGLVLATMFDVRVELFTVRDLFVIGAQDPVSGAFTSYFTTFVTISGGASAGRSRIRPALLDNDVFVDQVYKDNSAGGAGLAILSRNRQSNATTSSTAALIAVDSPNARVDDNVLSKSAAGHDAINVGVHGGSASIGGNECNGQNITTSASSGNNRLARNTNVGTKTLAATDFDDDAPFPAPILQSAQLTTDASGVAQWTRALTTAHQATTLNTAGPTLTPGDRSFLRLTHGASASGNVTIAAGTDGQLLLLFFASVAGTAVYTDGSGNLELSANFTPTANDTLTLLYDSISTKWVEIARSVN